MSRSRDENLDREIRSHLDAEVEERRAAGMSEPDAVRAARRAFGSVAFAREEVRAVWVHRWLDDLRRDVLYSLRWLVRAPTFTAAAVLTLAIGIGATAAIFSVVNGLLLAPLPFPDADRLVRIVENVPAEESFRGAALRLPALYAAEFDWWRTHATTLSHIAIQVPQAHTLTTGMGNVRLAGARVSPAMFPLRGVPPILGRGLHLDEERPGVYVVVLGESAWRRLFGGDPGIVGRSIVLDGHGYEVVGVMPRAFGSQDFWMPYVSETVRDGAIAVVPATARLRDGVSMEVAGAEVNGLGHRLRDAPLVPGQPPRFEVVPLHAEIVRAMAPALRVLSASVVIVMLLVCVNVANLLLTRSAARRHEMAVRRALGAARGRLFRQLLTESIVLAGAGGTAGLGLAYWGLRLVKKLAAVQLPAGFRQTFGWVLPPQIADVAIDPSVIVIAMTAAVVAGVMFGIGPALRLSRDDIRWGRFGTRGGRLLAAVQLALASILLTGAALLMSSFLRLVNVDLGFAADPVLTFDVVVPDHYLAEQKLDVAEQVAARLEALPGVAAAGFTDSPPLSNRMLNPLGVHRPPARTGRDPQADDLQVRMIGGNYLRGLGVQLLAGRWLDVRDRALRPQPILISKAYARYYFDDRDPIGSVLTTAAGPDWPAVVVGIVDDVRFGGLDAPPPLAAYADARSELETHTALLARRGRQRSAEANRLFLTGIHGTMAFAVRTTVDPASLREEVRRVVEGVDPSAAVDAMLPMVRVVAGSIAPPRFHAVLVGLFATAAALIAVIGIYGVVAYAVARRAREIGIRMAIGAAPAAVVWLVIRQGIAIVGIGVGAGMVGAVGLTRYLDGMLFGVTPLDAGTYAVVAVGFGAVALVASYIPARRAAAIDPLATLRSE
jgi:putative ABC transport system permease protein